MALPALRHIPARIVRRSFNPVRETLMFAVPVRAAATVALVAFATAGFAAKPTASSAVELSVTPSTVAVGGTTQVTTSFNNPTGRSVTFVAQYDITGPCGTDTSSTTFSLAGKESRTFNFGYTAPACPGDYTVQLTVSSDSNQAVAGTATFTVVN